MSTPATLPAIKPSNSQDLNSIKISDSQIPDNDGLHSDDEDQNLEPPETQDPSTTATNPPNVIGLQHSPSPTVDPTRPTTPPNPQAISTSTPHEKNPPNPPTTTTTTTTNSTKPQANQIPPALNLEADANPSKDEATTALPPYDWSLLLTRYEAALAPLSEQENALTAEFEAWTKLFHNWSLSGRRKEEQRGAKRLRTQVAYVRMREEGFEAGRRHYEKCKEQAERLLESLREDV